MHNKEENFEKTTTLSSSEAAPYKFSITIRESAGGVNRAFEITGSHPGDNSRQTKKYVLPDASHKSHLDFFERIAHDFGTRLPQNRRPNFKPEFEANYRVLLTENLAPGMLFGYGDPAVLRVAAESDEEESWYYLLSTSNDAPDSFPIIRSRNLEDWEFASFVFPRGSKPDWAADGESVGDFWAAELHRVENEFRVYFVARDRVTRELCIGVAKSARPGGPFIAEKEPILTDNVIDPHIFVSGETVFLYWKKDNNELWSNRLNELLYRHPQIIPELFPEKEDRLTASLISTLFPWAATLEPMERFLAQQTLIEAVASDFPSCQERLLGLLENRNEIAVENGVRQILEVIRTPIYAQELSADGLKLVGERTKILENDLPWEAHLVEGVWITKWSEKYYLFYAGNDFSTADYGIGVAVSDSPLGPFVKMPEPFFRSTADWAGPGHPSTTIAPDGKPIMLLHAFEPGKMGYKEFRALLAVPLVFESDRVLLG